MFNTILAQSWERSLLFNPNQEKIYFIPTRINDSQAWILPANFFIRSNEWTIIFEFNEVRIYLNVELGTHICLHKKMSGSEMKQFEREWVAFQSSNDETFDLQEFHFLN
jgi:hypothetical protein